MLSISDESSVSNTEGGASTARDNQTLMDWLEKKPTIEPPAPRKT